MTFDKIESAVQQSLHNFFLTVTYKARAKAFIKELFAFQYHGLSEYAFQAYIKTCTKQFRKCLSSQQVQKEAVRVWKGVENVFFGEGRDIHFKKYRDFNTI